MGIIKSGKVVVLLAGRFAGKKAVVVKANDEGAGDKKFAHALVAGIDVAPKKVVRASSKATIKRRSKIKPFIKLVNYTHILPTRYVVDLDLKKVSEDKDADKKALKKWVRKTFEERYLDQSAAKSEKKSAGTSYFFKKLRF